MSELRKGDKNPMFGKPGTMLGITLPKSQCPHCGIRVTPGNFKRWHGSNCKLLKEKNE